MKSPSTETLYLDSARGPCSEYAAKVAVLEPEPVLAWEVPGSCPENWMLTAALRFHPHLPKGELCSDDWAGVQSLLLESSEPWLTVCMWGCV